IRKPACAFLPSGASKNFWKSLSLLNTYSSAWVTTSSALALMNAAYLSTFTAVDSSSVMVATTFFVGAISSNGMCVLSFRSFGLLIQMVMIHLIAMDSSQTNASLGVVADGSKSCVGVPNICGCREVGRAHV